MRELQRLSDMASSQGSIVSAVLVQPTLTVCLAFTVEGNILIFDCHCHNECGAMIATASAQQQATIRVLLTSLLGAISDAHLCRLVA